MGISVRANNCFVALNEHSRQLRDHLGRGKELGCINFGRHVELVATNVHCHHNFF